MFRKFSESNDIDEDVEDALSIEQHSETEQDDNDLPNHEGPLTRSAVKPRLLFPSARQMKEKEMRARAVEEEEADTDIELPVATSSSSRSSARANPQLGPMKSTPGEQMDCDIATPKAPRFAPCSPPTTGRTTRSQKLELKTPSSESDDDRPATPTDTLKGSKKVSPFMGWQRTKIEATTSTRKRPGVSMPRSPTGKKHRRV